MSRELYQARVLDHAKHPRNKHALPNAAHAVRGVNASCGDALMLYLVIGEGTIIDAAFTGEGCAVSQAAASMLTVRVKGMTLSAAHKLTDVDMYALLGIDINPAREKCALLPLRTLKAALDTGRNKE